MAWGSVVTLAWQTSVSNMTIMSLTSLCLTAGKPPVLQVRACSTLNVLFKTTVRWQVLEWPTVSERKAVSESSLVQSELTHAHHGNGECMLLARWRLPFLREFHGTLERGW